MLKIRLLKIKVPGVERIIMALIIEAKSWLNPQKIMTKFILIESYGGGFVSLGFKIFWDFFIWARWQLKSQKNTRRMEQTQKWSLSKNSHKISMILNHPNSAKN